MDWLKTNLDDLEQLSILLGKRSAVELVECIYDYLRPDYEPLSNRFGKQAREYVSYTLGAPLRSDRDPEFMDEYNLLYRGAGGGRKWRISVQPGPLLLVLLVQLVHARSTIEDRRGAKLGDLLKLFDDIGIDFKSEPDDFEILKRELLTLDLLHSSADAAEAASLKARYSI